MLKCRCTGDSLSFYNFNKKSKLNEALDYLIETNMSDGQYLIFYNDSFKDKADEYIKRYNGHARTDNPAGLCLYKIRCHVIIKLMKWNIDIISYFTY